SNEIHRASSSGFSNDDNDSGDPSLRSVDKPRAAPRVEFSQGEEGFYPIHNFSDMGYGPRGGQHSPSFYKHPDIGENRLISSPTMSSLLDKRGERPYDLDELQIIAHGGNFTSRNDILDSKNILDSVEENKRIREEHQRKTFGRSYDPRQGADTSVNWIPAGSE
ncbi:MAG: hypothetical protein ACREAS_02770, partial [Nitrososphaera sp.]